MRYRQVVPFHRRIRVLLQLLVHPTAQALVAEVAATPNRSLPPTGFGLGTCAHAVPFHRSMSVWAPPMLPTAHAFAAETAATPERTLPAGPGLRTCAHAVPFHRSINVLSHLLAQPTAQALLA
jgi:hypothetical protein